ncbi:hypothetical protein GGI07_004255 [Coemansia sp. Benny D115]|nr:hypothetical protein GGI07_004255 [Coemansia sp. Benny D115]
MQVKLLVRSSSVPTADTFTVTLNVDQTTRDVKQAIEREHPHTPRARDMRIIWKGRLLNDADVLQDLVSNEPETEVYHTVVHFVLSVPMGSRTLLKKKEPERKRVDKGKSAERKEQTGTPLASVPTPSVIPLGCPFQYILVDGTPYLVQLKSHLQRPQQQQPLSYANFNTSAYTAPAVATPEDGHNMYNGRLDQQQQQQQRVQRRQAGQNDRQRHQQLQGVQLDEVEQRRARYLDFNVIWNVGWLMLRVLLFVAVFAHDASFERLFLLVAVVSLFILFRSEWAQERLRLLRQPNNGRNGDQRRRRNVVDHRDVDDDESDMDEGDDEGREYTAMEKAKALFIALFATFIPSEPIHPPMNIDEQI